MDLRNPVMHAQFKSSSRITHMELGIGELSGVYHIFQTFFASMSSLKFLVIGPDISFLRYGDSGADEICHLACLAACGPWCRIPEI